ncbi:hypothetical protein [Neobacillus dielmonensis]|uniref:hypothetical protein n=1 Tax=Neobacillus dielmonensis TaxID=1347369 RepID=UPI0005AB1D64|nr:hypothetical protein [Neobacillus dielmonensis]
MQGQESCTRFFPEIGTRIQSFFITKNEVEAMVSRRAVVSVIAKDKVGVFTRIPTVLTKIKSAKRFYGIFLQ